MLGMIKKIAPWGPMLECRRCRVVPALAVVQYVVFRTICIGRIDGHTLSYIAVAAAGNR